MDVLRRRFDLDDDEVAFVWNAVALTVDPRFAPVAHALAGSEARRGLTANLHAVIAGLGDARAHRLARRLRRSRPLARVGLVEAAESGSALTSMPVVASLRGLRRDCMLAGAVPLVCDIDELLGSDRDQSSMTRILARFVDETPGLIALTSTVPGLEVSRRSAVRITWPLPSTAVRRELWERYLGETADRDGAPHARYGQRADRGGDRLRGPGAAIATAQRREHPQRGGGRGVPGGRGPRADLARSLAARAGRGVPEHGPRARRRARPVVARDFV